MKIWLITDTHFNHERIKELSGRPDDFTERTLNNWSKMVGEDDLTIHLGDVIFSRPSELTDMMSRIPGRKVLVMGNHDRKPRWYMNHGFDFACYRFELGHTLFVHEPQFELPTSCERVIHGHLHNNAHRVEDYDQPIPNYNYLLSLEEEEYRPVLLETFLLKKGKIDGPAD